MADESISAEDMFRLLESNRKPVVEEIQRLIYQQFSESKDCGWLINGLYDYYAATQSLNGLKLLLNIKEPLDSVLCDRIQEGLKSSDLQSRNHAVNMLGFLARKQPTWIHKITQTHCFKDLIKLLRYENDAVLLVTSLLVLITLLPAIPAKIAPYLGELFEVFGRLSVYLHNQNNQELSYIHLNVALYAFFNRLYGMFPCNFLIWLRQQYPDSGREGGVFQSIVAPLLATVRMHPLLVTHSKDHEKSAARWKGLGEVHDVLAECSRYSVDLQESGSREDTLIPNFFDLPLTTGSALACNLDANWTPGKYFDVSNQTLKLSSADKKKLTSLNTSARYIDSPPEAAIEATPENTPYATPVKEEGHRIARKVPSSHAIRNLMKSPGPSSPTKNPISPFKEKDGKETSPFRWQDDERRDSIFGDIPASLLSKRDSLGLSRADNLLVNKMKSLTSDKVPEITRTQSLIESPRTSDRRVVSPDPRPSPVKFTKEPQVPSIRPMAEKPGDKAGADKQQVFGGVLDENDEDNEVSSLTKSGEVRMLDGRHITPHIFPESAGGSTPMTPCSRTQSRISTGSATPLQGVEGHDGGPSINIALSSVDSPTPFTSIAKSSRSQALAVDEFVQSVRKRVRYITLCEPEDEEPEEEEITEDTSMIRSSSCPQLSIIHLAVPEPKQRSPVKSAATIASEDNKVKTRSCTATQTEEGLMLLPWEHLFPASLPMPTQKPEVVQLDPYNLLDKHVESAIKTIDKSGDPTVLRDEIALLHSHLLFERQRREILGARNRRLLGKTKNFRDLEEQNLALNDVLQMAQSEIKTLHNQLETLRAEKHDGETQWSSSTREQEKKFLDLQTEKEDLKLRIQDLESRLEESSAMEAESRTEAENSKADLFQTKAKLEKLKGKEMKWEKAEEEMEKMKKQMVLQSELIRSYKDKLDMYPAKTSNQQIRLITEAVDEELASLKADYNVKNTELTVANATIADLEGKVKSLNQCLEEQKTFLAQTQEENNLNIQAAEDRLSGMRRINSHLEMTVLELQERLERVMKQSRRGGGRKGISPSSDSLELTTSLNYVHSGSSSVHGSVGSDPGEHIRRAIEMPNPLQIDTEKQISPEIGSAQSAHPDTSGAQSPTSEGSLNGQNH